ncbi:ERG2/sigma1 receptor-like protein [Jimgerdemannia flammicorona]|uniref:C-8 sterol isomerase n=1 Tax=Jimgerdemannia flammicorona TaxID=994334 RepID=A0A433QIM3_9FUNG|nr:ERG2/sigma1 receptor-like protein [Jimgerdemannia flammicorona]
MTRLTLYTVLLATFVGLIAYLDTIKDQFYIFDPNTLQKIAQDNIARYDGNDTQALIDGLVADLHAQYPSNINVKQEWVFNNAGGAMGAMYIIHASITEYVILFGTPVGTEGHTGRFFADDYFIILEGEQWAFAPGQLKKEIYLPGNMHHLARGDSQQYKIPEHGWALEYARGWIPSMLPFGIADTIFSTLDFTTLYHIFRLYGKSVVGQLLAGKF